MTQESLLGTWYLVLEFSLTVICWVTLNKTFSLVSRFIKSGWGLGKRMSGRPISDLGGVPVDSQELTLEEWAGAGGACRCLN